MTAEAPSLRRLTYAGYTAFILIGWNSVIIPSLIRSIEHDFSQSDKAFALFYFVSALMYAVGAFSGGFLTERLGRRIMLTGGAALLMGGLIPEALAPTWMMLIVLAAPVNWGAGILDGGTNGLFLDLYRQARGGALSLLHVFFGVGALTGPLITGLLLAGGASWRAVPLLAGISCLSLLGLFLTTPMPAGLRSGRTEREEAEAQSEDRASLLPFAALAVAIGLNVAAEGGVANWIVRLLSDVPIEIATAALSIYWIGLSLGRLLSNRIAERFDYFAFTIGCILLGGAALSMALLSTWLPLTLALFAISGLFVGPVFPMIVAIGGVIYPQRAAALGGALTASAVVGGLIYPPLIGLMAGAIGIRGGLFGAALLAVPNALAILVAKQAARRVPGSAVASASR